ncbi:MAG: serine/threonine-protein phosphatase [Magnetococcales bacterium]|nr:serine/threonine-protein phosphatase [Magnetococcales bacterium]
MAWQIALNAHIGGRDEQQDRSAQFVSPKGDACLVVVADGMGGHQGGALAAQTVVDVARKIFAARLSTLSPPELLETIIQQAHLAINRIGREQDVNPRSTAVLLLLTPGKAHWVHVGDCRLYHFRRGRLLHRTRDHSVFQMLVDMGKAKPEEAATHPDQSRLLSSLGGDKKPEVEPGTNKPRPGDGFLLCSDGLWEVVDERDMAFALHNTALDLADASRQLAEGATRNAGPKSDNVSVALVRVEGREFSLFNKIVASAVVTMLLALAGLWLWPAPPSVSPSPHTSLETTPDPVIKQVEIPTPKEPLTPPAPTGSVSPVAPPQHRLDVPPTPPPMPAGPPLPSAYLPSRQTWPQPDWSYPGYPQRLPGWRGTQ